MQIDNYAAAQALTKKISAHLPIRAYPSKKMMETMQERGSLLDPKNSLIIESVSYSGDMGGIMCVLEDNLENEEKFVVSITHLKIDPDHPLAPEIKAYQHRRVTMLKLEDQKGFAAELLKQRLLKPKNTKPKSNKKGFG
ncbi:MAG: hypothetical protein HC916_01535 [Coleofasciculaceae cyanobacterium SM2_1_6]|nr:hypothetical protein [Coleofasciculaceae cyanobacterium SM2_1_6]